MRYLLIQLCTFLCLLTNYTTSQQNAFWQRFYDGGYNEDDYLYGICRIADGNFILDGYTAVIPNPGTMILKIANDGEVLRLTHYQGIGAGPLIPTSDGGSVIAFGGGFFKMNPLCDSLWTKPIPNIGYGRLNDIITTMDGGYIACGYAFYDSGYVVKTDSVCNYTWQKIISDPNLRIKFNKVIEAYSDGYLIGGYTFAFNEPMRTLILRIDHDGNIKWEKNYLVNNIGGNVLKIFKLYANYLIAVSNGFLRIDDFGDILSSKPMEHDSITSNRDIQMITDNKFVVIANSSTTMFTNSKLMNVDSSLNIQSSKLINFSEFVRLSKIQTTGNDDFLFAGEAEINNSIPSDIYIIRCDTNFNYPPIKIKTISTSVPKNFKLFQNYPNPFNPVTKIKFDIAPLLKRGGVDPATAGDRVVSLKLYDLLGRKVAILLNQSLQPGTYEVEFDGSNFASGVYFYRLEAGSFVSTKKMVLIK